MLDSVKRAVKHAALRRWDIEHFSPNGAPPALYRYLNGRTDLNYLDVGAHQGSFFASLAEIGQFNHVVLVEPLPEFAAMLRTRYPNAEVVEAALGPNSGKMEINYFPQAEFLSSMLPLEQKVADHVAITKGERQPLWVDVKTLDELLTPFGGLPIDLLKIDTQGYEMDVLRRGTNFLKQTQAIWIEVSFIRLYHNSCLFHEIHNHLYANGFIMSDLSPGWRTEKGELAQGDAFFIRPR